MKAYVCHAFGDYHELMIDELPDEPPGLEEVRIDSHAFGIGFPEMLMVQGRYQLRPPLPFVPGMECSGIVTDVGHAVTEFKPGDHVMGTVRFGAFASSVRLSRETCLAVPTSSMIPSAAMYSTSHCTVLRRLDAFW